jgi:hypothetical protein
MIRIQQVLPPLLRNRNHLFFQSSKSSVLNRGFAVEAKSQPPSPPPDPDKGKRNFRSFAVSGVFCAVLLYFFTLPAPPIDEPVEISEVGEPNASVVEKKK